MEIYEKIGFLLEERKLKLKPLHRKIKELFADRAIAYLTLYRTVKGVTKVRESSLFQISTALGISSQKLKEGTERAEPKIGDFIKKEVIIGRHVYNKNAYLEVLSGSDLSFLPAKLVMLPAAKTPMLQDPGEKGGFIKWVYGLQGEVTLNVTIEEGIKKYILHKGDKVYFESACSHYFENNTSKRAACLIIQNPRHI